jgi:hypothetical protein
MGPLYLTWKMEFFWFDLLSGVKMTLSMGRWQGKVVNVDPDTSGLLAKRFT